MLLGQSVDGVVGLAHPPEVAADGVGDVLAGDPALLVDLGDVDLDGGVVLDADEAARGGALPLVDLGGHLG